MTSDTNYPVPNNMPPFMVAKKLEIKDFLPQFNYQQIPAVFIQNTRFDAGKFNYKTPYVVLGQAGFLVDYGFQLGYFNSTWQGQTNPGLRFQDLNQLLQFAAQRTRNDHDFNSPQLGLWSEHWQIGGDDALLVGQLQKMYNDLIKNRLYTQHP